MTTRTNKAKKSIILFTIIIAALIMLMPLAASADADGDSSSSSTTASSDSGGSSGSDGGSASTSSGGGSSGSGGSSEGSSSSGSTDSGSNSTDSSSSGSTGSDTSSGSETSGSDNTGSDSGGSDDTSGETSSASDGSSDSGNAEEGSSGGENTEGSSDDGNTESSSDESSAADEGDNDSAADETDADGGDTGSSGSGSSGSSYSGTGDQSSSQGDNGSSDAGSEEPVNDAGSEDAEVDAESSGDDGQEADADSDADNGEADAEADADESDDPDVELTDEEKAALADGESVEVKDSEGNSYTAKVEALDDNGDPVGYVILSDGETTFKATATEIGSSTPLGSIQFTLPDSFNVDSSQEISPEASGDKSWSGGLVERILSLWADSENDYLGQGESVWANFTATPTAVGNHEVTTEAWQDADNVSGGTIPKDSSGNATDLGVATNNMAAGYTDPKVWVAGQVHEVKDGGSIQDVIADADNYDVIDTKPGNYDAIEVDKPLYLKGAHHGVDPQDRGDSFDGASIINAAGAANAVKIISNNVIFDGFTVTGADSKYEGAIFLDRVEGSTIKNNIVVGNERAGIYMYQSDHNTIANNVIKDNTLGIHMVRGGYASSSSCNYNTIVGNLIENNTSTGISLITSYGQANAATGNLFLDNIIRENGGTGISIQGGVWVANTIEGNTISGHNSFGIDNNGGAQNNIIRNNIIDDNNRGGYGGAGVARGDGIRLQNFTASSFNETRATFGNVIEGNTITNHFNGINLRGSTHFGNGDFWHYDNVIRDNTITSNTGNGIVVRASIDNLIEGNSITNNNRRGISFEADSRVASRDDGASNNRVVGNMIYGNGQYGVYAGDKSVDNDARGNYWGHNSGPEHVSNPDGQGDKVSDHVLIDDWKHAIVIDLRNSLGNPLSGGIVKLGVGGWPVIGFTGDDGKLIYFKDEPFGNTRVRVTAPNHGGTETTDYQDPLDNNVFQLQTHRLVIELLDHEGGPLDGGEVRIGYGGWPVIGFTGDDEAGVLYHEHFAGNQNFRMGYNYGTETKSHTHEVGGSTLTFQLEGDNESVPNNPLFTIPLLNLPTLPLNLPELPVIPPVPDAEPPAQLLVAPEAPLVNPGQYLVIPPADPETQPESLITVLFLTEGTAADLEEVLAAYNFLFAEFDENWEELSEEEYALAYIDLTVAWAAINARDAALLAEEDQEFDLDAVVEAYELALEALEEYGEYLNDDQMETLTEILDAVGDLVDALPES